MEDFRLRFRSASWQWLLIAVTTVSGSCGCDVASNESLDSPGTKAISLQLNWRADPQHGGFYAAQLLGDYAAEGLSVEIIEGGPGTPVIPKLVMGRIDFAIANADQILQVREQEADIVGIMAPLQHSPRCIMVHRASGIERLEDLKNLTLAMNEGLSFAMFLKSRVTLDNVRIVPYGGTIAKFLIDPNHAQQAYVFSEPLLAERQGSDPLPLLLSELGFDPYASVLAVSNQTIKQRPELVRKFVAASIRGWRKYLESPQVVNDEILRLNPNMDRESLDKAVIELRELCLPDDLPSDDLGKMSAARWLSLAQQMKSIGAISGDPESAAKTAWKTIR